MAQEISEYEQFRLVRLGAGFDDDNNSAHFSLKDSNMNLSDRIELDSARSTPQTTTQQLVIHKKYEELEQRHNALMQKYAELQAAYQQSLRDAELKEEENSKLREQMARRRELQRQTKKRLKQWVAQAKREFQ